MAKDPCLLVLLLHGRCCCGVAAVLACRLAVRCGRSAAILLTAVTLSGLYLFVVGSLVWGYYSSRHGSAVTPCRQVMISLLLPHPAMIKTSGDMLPILKHAGLPSGCSLCQPLAPFIAIPARR